MIEIDNKKMWESILSFKCEVKIEDLKNNPAGIAIKCIGDSIKHALKEQNLEYKDGEIVSNRWYKCIRSFETARTNFEEGESYRYCEEVRRNIKYFRLDTDTSDVPETLFGDMLKAAATKVKDSNTLKDALTEFEQCLKSGTNIYVEQGRRMEDRDAKEDAKELLEIARRTILAEEIELAYKTRDEIQYKHGYKEGKKEFIEQIEKIITNPLLFDEDRVYEMEKLIKEFKG